MGKLGGITGTLGLYVDVEGKPQDWEEFCLELWIRSIAEEVLMELMVMLEEY